jgi:hypothetical protein
MAGRSIYFSLVIILSLFVRIRAGQQSRTVGERHFFAID